MIVRFVYWFFLLPPVDVNHLLAAAFVTAVFVSLVLCLLDIKAALVMMVDSFCNCFLEERDIVERLRDWNEVQAIIRQASGAMTPCFVTIHVTALAIFGLVLWDAVTGDAEGFQGVGLA